MSTITFTNTADRPVRDIMSKDVIKVYPDTPVSQIARLMADNDISGVPVVDKENKVLGVITELDLVLRNTHFKLPTFFMILDQLIYLQPPQEQKRLERMLGVTAEEIMTKPAITITPDTHIDDLSDLIVERRLNPIPVVEDERLVGIVSRSDIVRLMADPSEAGQSEADAGMVNEHDETE
jgi:CBS domain-containing protein